MWNGMSFTPKIREENKKNYFEYEFILSSQTRWIRLNLYYIFLCIATIFSCFESGTLVHISNVRRLLQMQYLKTETKKTKSQMLMHTVSLFPPMVCRRISNKYLMLTQHTLLHFCFFYSFYLFSFLLLLPFDTFDDALITTAYTILYNTYNIFIHKWQRVYCI